MLRSLLIGLAKAKWAQNIVTRWRLARRVVSRFVAGETLEGAIDAVKVLNAAGLNATIDQLGENTLTRQDTASAVLGVMKILEAIDEHRLRANVSIKLSQIGLVLDEEFCRENLEQILLKARELKNFIRIDMEDSGLTEKTIAAYLWVRGKGYTNVGIVVQSYLYRTLADVQRMNQYDTRVRLCKGAYKEPAAVAFPSLTQVDENFDQLVRELFKNTIQWKNPQMVADGRTPPIAGIATHDRDRIDFAVRQAEEVGLQKSSYEFQMLYGIRRDLQNELVQRGHLVRVYTPFGTHWYPYFMRRLAERPANLWFFISNFFRK